MRKIEHTGMADNKHPFALTTTFCFWPLIKSDQWFLPRFKIKIKNLGPEIKKGEFSVYIADYENLKSFSEISSYPGPFQDVDHQILKNLKTNDEIVFQFRIESNYIKPGRYILRIVIHDWLSAKPLSVQIEEACEKITAAEEIKETLINRVIAFAEESGSNPHLRNSGQYTSKLLLDQRCARIIKIESLYYAIAPIALIIGAIVSIATAIKIFYS